MTSRSAPPLNNIQNDSVKPYVDEIRTELGLTTKHISAASYRVKKLDELIPQINRSLAEKHNPSGPVVTSLVNQVMSAIDSVDAITHKLEEASDNINVNLDIIENFEDLDGFDPREFSEDISYLRNSVKFKIDNLQGDFLTRKIQMENAQSLILLTQSKLEKSTSGTSSYGS